MVLQDRIHCADFHDGAAAGDSSDLAAQGSALGVEVRLDNGNCDRHLGDGDRLASNHSKVLGANQLDEQHGRIEWLWLLGFLGFVSRA